EIADPGDAPARVRPDRSTARGEVGTACDRGAVHGPDRDLAGRVVAPENVLLAVAVEVADAGDTPTRIRRHRGAAGGHRVAGHDGRAIHGPDHERAVAVAPEDVASGVAVEVAGAGDTPGCAGRHRNAAHIDDAARQDGRAVHAPDREQPVAVAPERVGGAVAGEIGDRGDVPACA